MKTGNAMFRPKPVRRLQVFHNQFAIVGSPYVPVCHMKTTHVCAHSPAELGPVSPAGLG